MDRLKREGNPPVGQLASPIPQYKRPGSTDYDPVEGQHGAPFAILKDASGNVVSPATDAKLEQVKSELELVKSELATIKANQLSGDQKVQLSGTIDSLLHSLTSARMINNDIQIWGETVVTTGYAKSIDISGASQVVVVLENKHDVAVNVTHMYLTREAGQVLGVGHVNAVYQEVKLTSIPAGASVYLDKEIYATLGKIGVGLVLRIERHTAPTSGDLTMLVYGRRN